MLLLLPNPLLPNPLDPLFEDVSPPYWRLLYAPAPFTLSPLNPFAPLCSCSEDAWISCVCVCVCVVFIAFHQRGKKERMKERVSERASIELFSIVVPVWIFDISRTKKKRKKKRIY